MAARDVTCDEFGPGRWEHRGAASFLFGEPLRCDAYRWHADSKGKVAIDFVCPADGAPRRFFATDWLKELEAESSRGRRLRRGRGRTDGYLDRVTRWGIPSLREFEESLGGSRLAEQGAVRPTPPGHVYEMFHALFRGREQGHYAVRRVFNKRSDFLDVGARSGEKCLVPEMAGAGAEQPRRIIERIENSCASAAGPAGPAGPFPVGDLPLRNALDTLLVDGAELPLGIREVGGLWSDVSSALINGFRGFDGRRCDADPATRHKFNRGLWVAFRGKSREEFDGWFRVEREKGFVRLLGAGVILKCHATCSTGICGRLTRRWPAPTGR